MRKDRKFSGAGSDTDVVVSSARAYTSAINKLLSWKLRRSMMTSGAKTSQIGSAGAVSVGSTLGVTVVAPSD